MNKKRSFVPSDFTLRNIPGFLIIYLAISFVSIILGLLIEALPSFGRGMLCGAGLGFFAALFLLYPKKNIDISSLPEPSASVRAILDDPNSSLIDAVKLYREETGCNLSEVAAVLKAYQPERQVKD